MSALKLYFTLSIPYTDQRNEWTPPSATGPFRTLQRGCFKRPEDAHAWADKHIPGRRYGIKRVTQTADGEAVVLIWAGLASGRAE